MLPYHEHKLHAVYRLNVIHSFDLTKVNVIT